MAADVVLPPSTLSTQFRDIVDRWLHDSLTKLLPPERETSCCSDGSDRTHRRRRTDRFIVLAGLCTTSVSGLTVCRCAPALWWSLEWEQRPTTTRLGSGAGLAAVAGADWLQGHTMETAKMRREREEERERERERRV